jgi:hypothetical protein
VTNKVTQTKLVTQELLLCYTSKKVTSKLHKLTSYKSNYTSTMYMKVVQACVMGMQTNGTNKVDIMIFIPRFTCLPTR